ncbi:MAG: acyltransferase [Hyphomicrobiaceae bacterium]
MTHALSTAFSTHRQGPVRSTGPSDQIASLDGLRAISILLVVVSHAGLSHIVPGRLGVTIFFFLSGYLITTLVLREYEATGTISIGQFYARRAFRLMPPLLITLAIAYSLTYLGVLAGGISLNGLLAQTFYFANYYMIFTDGAPDTPFGTGLLWSLAVEEHFYLAYPFVLLLLLTTVKSRGKVAAAFAAICLAVLAWRIHLIQQPGVGEPRLAFASDTRIDSLLYGCLLAIVKNPLHDLRPSDRIQGRHWALLAAGLGLMASTLLIRNWHFRETVRYSIQGLALAPLFYLAIRFAHQGPFRLLNVPVAKRIGVFSYSIYLIHEVAIGLITYFAPTVATRPLLLLPIVLAMSIAFSVLIDKLVDPYFRRLRSQFRPVISAGIAST